MEQTVAPSHVAANEYFTKEKGHVDLAGHVGPP